MVNDKVSQRVSLLKDRLRGSGNPEQVYQVIQNLMKVYGPDAPLQVVLDDARSQLKKLKIEQN